MKTKIDVTDQTSHYKLYKLKLWKKITLDVSFHNKKFTYCAINPDGVSSSNTVILFSSNQNGIFGDKNFKITDIRILGQRIIDLADKIEKDME